ncbi:pyridoxal-phosphate dependent enzyme [Fulvivirga imtechensis]|nr:pyridoxal-phosphate dependent enzyme [Fulvivirga imtechensis]
MPENIYNKEASTDTSAIASTTPDMSFEKRCLYCGEVNNSENYTCDCIPEEWFNEYRILDVKPVITSKEKLLLRQSFYDYRFDHPDGIVQYYGVPFRAYYPKGLEPVGMTPLYYLPHLSDQYGIKTFIKNEGHNPSGCFKDRETLLTLLNTRRRGLRHAVIYSSGNAAASAAIFAQKLNMQLITFVAGDTYPEKINFIRDHGSDVVVIGDEQTNFETGFRLFARLNSRNVFSENNFDNWSVRNPYRVHGDKTTAIEIVKQLSGDDANCTVPDYVVVPTANGSGLAGIWKGFQELYALGLISKLPKMISAGIARANPVFQAVRKKQTQIPERCDLTKVDPEDASIGSTILAEEGYDSIEAAKAVLHSGGLAVAVNNSDVKLVLRDFLEQEEDIALKNSILPEPASLISIAAIEKMSQHINLAPDNIVVSIITGHGLKAQEMMEQLLPEKQILHQRIAKIIETKRGDIAKKAISKGRRKNVPADFDAIAAVFRELKIED